MGVPGPTGSTRPLPRLDDGQWIRAAVAVRLAIAVLIVAGPWLDSPAELDGFDVERFHEIAHAPGQTYVDHEVEYPPGSVALIEVASSGGLVAAHRAVVAIALLADLATAALLGRFAGSAAARRYLLLGSLLLPAILLRFDTVSVLLAVAALAALTRRHAAGFGAAIVAGFMVKTWPVALLGLALVRRWWAGLAAGTATIAAALGTWVAVSGSEGVRQVATFRHAEGWHIESGPGVVVHLLTGLPGADLESGAFRFGGMPAWTPLVTLVAVGGAWLWTWRRRGELSDAAVALALVATLMAAAPLLSVQFAIWIVPLLALAWPDLDGRSRVLGIATLVLTSVVMVAIHPSAADQLWPQLVLLARNAALAGVAISVLAGPSPDRRPRAGTGGESPHSESRGPGESPSTSGESVAQPSASPGTSSGGAGRASRNPWA